MAGHKVGVVEFCALGRCVVFVALSACIVSLEHTAE